MRPLVILLCLLTATGCGVHVTQVTPALVAAAQVRFPTTTAAELARGREQFTTSCVACHGQRDPRRYTVKEWEGYVQLMAPRVPLDRASAQAVLRFVVTAAEMPPDP